MSQARGELAAYLGVEPDDLVYFPNPTTAVNMLARSLGLGPGDEVLATDHEYGAMDRTWRFLCRGSGASYVRRSIPLPVRSPEELVEAFWAGVGERTRVIFISHITSSTALVFPVREICRRARASGILSIVDGAHAPGQIPLHLGELGADLYTGACHKWLGAPKGSAFLYARREIQARLQPLVVSWGWESDSPSGSAYVDHHEWQGTRDMAAFLATPAAIRFQAENDWVSVRARCHELVREARRKIGALTGLDPLSPDSPQWFAQMVSLRLPPVDVDALKARLYDEHRVEVPLFVWNDLPLLRVSIQAYNSPADVNRLLEGLAALLPETVKPTARSSGGVQR
jgi:isopenicillin-N epimerase